MSTELIEHAELPPAASGSAVHVHDAAVIGAGFAGLGMSIRLRQEGIEDFVAFERASSVGGTWRDNTYPGCACDVPSHLYSLSFAPNPGWSRSFSAQPEIWSYLQRTRRRVRRPAALPLRLRGDRRPLGRRGQGLGPADAAGGVSRPRPDRRHRRVDRAADARRPGPGRLRGRGLPLGALEPRLRPGGQAGRGDRHRRFVDPVRAEDPAAGGGAAPLPAHPGLDRPARRSSDQRHPQAPVQAASRPAAAEPLAALLGPRDARPRLHQASAADAPAPARRRAPPARAGRRIRSCAASSPPTTRSAASAR